MTPSHYALLMVSLSSSESKELDGLNYPHGGEVTPIGIGDRVSMVTVEGEFPGTVIDTVDWDGAGVMVHIDHYGPVRFHRSVFRAWTVLDYLAAAQVGAVPK